MKYVEPVNTYAYPERKGSYLTANPTTGLRGSWVPGEALEHPMREIVHVIEKAGLTPSSADLTQLYQAILLLSPKITGFLPLIGGTMEGSILAQNDNAISLGSAVKRFKEIFAVRFRGISDSADKLQTTRYINGVPFNGTDNVNIYPHTAAYLGSTGYIILYGSGLILQWGYSAGYVSFPIVFPNYCLSAQYTIEGGWGDETVPETAFSVRSISRSGMYAGLAGWYSGRYLAIGC